MAAPTFISEAETTFNTSTTPKTTAAMTNLTGDILLCLAGAGDANTSSVTPTLTGESWGTALENIGTSGANGRVHIYALTVTSGGTGETVSLARVGNANFFGANVLTFRASDGIGAAESAQIAAGSSAPTLNITTTQDNSAIGYIVVDWNAADGASRTHRTVNSITPTSGNGYELTYFRDAANWTVYIAYIPDAGTAGAKTVGLSAPTGMRWTIGAVEIKGTGAAPPAAVRLLGTLGAGT